MEFSQIDAANATVGLGNTIAIGSVTFVAIVHAAREFEGPVKVAYTTLAIAQGLGLLALSLAQAASIYMTKEKEREARVAKARARYANPLEEVARNISRN